MSRKKSAVPAIKTGLDKDHAEQVLRLILAGVSAHDIHNVIAAKFIGEDAGPLIADAMKEIEEASRYDPDKLLGWCILSAKDLHRRMVENKDYTGALQAIKQIMSMRTHVSSDEEEGIGEEQGGPPATEAAGLRIAQEITSGDQQAAVP